MKFRLVFILLVFVISASARASEQTDFKELQTLFSSGKYEIVVARGLDFETRFARSDRLGQVKNLLGLSYYMLRKPGQAIIQFNQALDRTSDVGTKPFIQFNLASAQAEAEFFDEASQTLSMIHPDSLDRDTRGKFHLLRGKILQKQGVLREAVIEGARSSRYIDPQKVRPSPAAALVDQGLAAIEDPSALEDILSQTEDTPFADAVMLRWGARLIATGKQEQGGKILKKLQLNFPKSEKYQAATELLRSVESQGEVNPNVIGLLLPLTGKYAQISQRVIQAAAMSLKIFNPEDSDTQFRLAIADSGENPERAIQGMNELCLQQHAIAVIGPLLSKGSDLVSAKAQDLGVPLLTLTQQEPVGGTYTFSFGITPQVQTQQIAQYAIEKLKLKRFAILYPRDKNGEIYSQSFWDAVEALGGTITGVEAYPADETDFRKWIDRLVGVYYTESRKRELDDLEKTRTENDITKKNRKTEKFFSLPPIVDFDAVYIPDEPKNLGQIVPTFAYRDVDHVKFFGNAAWHAPELLSRAQTSVEGAVFVDALNSDALTGPTAKFVDKFKTTYGAMPGSVEALAFDAVSILAQNLQNGGASNRKDLRDKLTSASYPMATTGKIQIKENQVIRNFPLFTVKAGKFELIY